MGALFSVTGVGVEVGVGVDIGMGMGGRRSRMMTRPRALSARNQCVYVYFYIVQRADEKLGIGFLLTWLGHVLASEFDWAAITRILIKTTSNIGSGKSSLDWLSPSTQHSTDLSKCLNQY